MRLSTALSLALALALPASALGQSLSAAPLDDRPAVKINEVERGLSLGTEAGGVLLFAPGAKSGSGLSLGRSFGLSLGVDLSNRLGIGVLMAGDIVQTPERFVSNSGMSGGFSAFSLAATVRFAPLVRADSSGVQRFFWWVRGGAGFSTMNPKGFYDGNDVLLMAGTGIEYFTHLRHFSIGIDGDLVYGPKVLGAGVKLTPYLHYTF